MTMISPAGVRTVAKDRTFRQCPDFPFASESPANLRTAARFDRRAFLVFIRQAQRTDFVLCNKEASDLYRIVRLERKQNPARQKVDLCLEIPGDLFFGSGSGLADEGSLGSFDQPRASDSEILEP